MKEIKKSLELGGRTLTLSTGKVANQASGAVIAQYGETVVLATVVSSELTADLDYFPLSVEYQERLYAGGRIKGSRWVKREGRPSDDEVLKARLIDRSIRPLFPKNYKKDVQVIVTVLSVDMENDPVFLAPLAVSAAIEASNIPWYGPVGVLSVGLKEDSYFVNPRESEVEFSDMDLVVSSTKNAVVMIEAGANEVPEEKILGGIEFAFKETQEIISFIEKFAKETGNKKEKYADKTINTDLEKQVKKLVDDKLADIISRMAQKEGGADDLNLLKEAVADAVGEESARDAKDIIEVLLTKKIREMILAGKRPDGRKLSEIRKLSSEVGVLPRTHGSAIFTRGQTQVLNITTLGAPSLGQLIETAEGEEEKRYIHHYSMPPYSVGETGRVGSPSRREIGHGALAERALMPVIPSEKDFPYAIRLVSEVTSSNGSTSMASTCASTLSLMDAGVPIKSPVSGIAMGLIIDDKKVAVLSDISGIEDFNGDMDFKVTGTKDGVTALQLDVKTLSLTPKILKDALIQAKEGRIFILESMLKTIKEPREKVSTYAPKIKTISIDPEKIGEVIGPGGKMIKRIIAETGAEVEVEDDGTVNISGMKSEDVEQAIEWIESLTKEVQAGEIYKGIVKRIQPFGAFVEILPGKDGLVHISDMSEGFVKNPEDVVSLNQQVEVRVKEIDNLGRINLSMILDPSRDKEKENSRTNSRENRNDRSRGRDFTSRKGRVGRRSGDSTGGPHFPASRLIDSEKKVKRFSR